MQTVDTAPEDTPILVWVRDANKDGSGSWKPGRVIAGYGLPPDAVAPIHTRFDALEWFVWDAEHPLSDLNHAEVIRQAETLEEALRGL